MKNLLKVTGILLLTVLQLFLLALAVAVMIRLTTIFAGTYRGNVSYRNNSNSTTINNTNGSVFVTKIASGTRYNFSFQIKFPI